ncbi:MAG: hypothetical protein ACREEH_08010 [Caulobacteraceae bacterium]
MGGEEAGGELGGGVLDPPGALLEGGPMHRIALEAAARPTAGEGFGL